MQRRASSRESVADSRDRADEKRRGNRAVERSPTGSSADTSMVRLDGVSREYADGFAITVSLSIPKGRLISLLGPSGSGKTTTLRFIAGFEEADAGRISIAGHDVTHVSPADRRVGFVFQDYTLFPHMSVFENVAYGLRVRKTPADEVRRRVEHFLSVVGLPDYGNRDVHTLSGGERQRIALARALVIEPDVLLLDEPFSSIDAILRRDLRREVVRLQRSLGVTTIFVTHSRDEAMSIADHLVVIRGGEIIQEGPPEDVFAAPVDRFVASFVGDANFLEGVVSPTAEGPILASFRDFVVQGEAPTREAGARSVLIRPHHLYFAEPGWMNAFPVLITERQYFAHFFEYTCRSTEDERREFVVYDTNRRAVGASTHLAFDPQNAYLLADG